MEQTTKCLKDLLADTSEKAKVGAFLKTAEEKLAELAKAADAEEANYRDALPNLRKKWEEQDEQIRKLEDHIKTCYPEWEHCLEEAVCKEVIQNIWRLRTELKDKLGPPEWYLELAKADLAKAASQLEAWKTILKWIQDRLDANQKLIEEICTLDNCSDRLFVPYIFYFELLPAHKQLEKAPDQLPPRERDPERAYCESACSATPPERSEIEFCGYPWLIGPNDYNCKLADVWEIWRKAGVAQAVAECKFEQVAKCREDYEAASDPSAKRDAARDALRRCDEKSSPSKSQQRNEGASQQPQQQGA